MQSRPADRGSSDADDGSLGQRAYQPVLSEGIGIRKGAFPILHSQVSILHYSRSPRAVTHASAGGKGRLGISRRSTGAISLWNSSSVARCCFLVRPSPSAFTCSTSCPSCSWYRSTL